jgi:hypothetical protein
MNTVIDITLISCSIFLTTVFVLVTFAVKHKLEKLGYRVTFLNISTSDYSNLNKLRKEDPKYKALYIALFYSTVGGGLAIILFLFSMIFE